MKKILSLLASVMLTLCLVAFAFDRLVPASAVHAGCDACPLHDSAGPAAREAAPLPRPAQAVVSIVIGLFCVLFGMIAAAPLLIEGSDAVIARHLSNQGLGAGGRRSQQAHPSGSTRQFPCPDERRAG